MIQDGVWPKNISYISCDDYDGKNSPPRYGLDLRKAFKKNPDEVPTYGPINITTNGESQMEFQMQLTAVSIRDGAGDKSELLGTWKAGLSNDLSLVETNAMSNYTADVVYRVVTVIVSITLKTFR